MEFEDVPFSVDTENIGKVLRSGKEEGGDEDT